MARCPNTIGRHRAPRWLWAAATVMLVAVNACSDDSDEGEGDTDATNADRENGQEQGPDTNGQDEPLEATYKDGTLRLTVDSVTREADLVVIEGTITNTSNERFTPVGEFTELDFGGLERFQSNDLSGFVVIDWEHGTAHYPARNPVGECACTIVEDRREARLDPGDSMDYFVAYRLDDPPAELTLVAPEFQPVDGIPVDAE